jgi:hypothetical protein
MTEESQERKTGSTHGIFVVFFLGELSQFFVSKSPYDSSSRTGTFSVGISGPSTVFLDANETEFGYEVKNFLI